MPACTAPLDSWRPRLRPRTARARRLSPRSAEPEPWRQQLLNTAVSVGCSILGAATAVLIIRRSQAA